MLLATITFFEPNGRTGETLAVGRNEREVHEKIKKIRKFIEGKGFRFLSSIIEEVKNVTDPDALLIDLLNAKKVTLH